MQFKRRKFYFIFLSCLIALMLFYHYKGNIKTPNYTTFAVRKGEIVSYVLATGRMDAIERVSIGAQVTGQIKSINVKTGEHICKGQLIAVIDDTPQLNDLRNAEAARDIVKADLIAKRALLKPVELHYNRLVYLLKRNLLAKDDFDSAEASFNAGRAEIASLEAQLVQAQIELERKKIELAYTKVVAPMDGVVIAILTNQGQTVNSSQTAPTIIQLARLDTMTIKVQISEADISRVHIGQEAYFTILSDPLKRYKSTLKTIELAPESVIKSLETSSSQASEKNFSGAPVYYNALLNIPNTDNKFFIGMTAEVSLQVARDSNALLIPIQALQSIDGSEGLVQVLNNKGKVEKRKIKTGIKDETNIQVVKGLNEAERVIIPSLHMAPSN
ncbi:efflux RND transporter periplasmic adaptor subunit [Pantoea ananatis]|uniref:efflux RND transporter periplasmic adaptor subunit n=1 Tax=Pantoea ananas TaxID=553 RepID=UPI003FA431A9